MEKSATSTKEKDLGQLAGQAKDILEGNWTCSFTIPAAGQYPHQWSWDSVFIAMGYMHYNQERAEMELRRLFSGQWSNGMIPHIIFAPNDCSDIYFPGPDFWQTGEISNAPENPKTSGICQPPIHATGLLHMIKFAPDRERALEFAREFFPKLKAWYKYLHRTRDPQDEGLVYIRHPWESGQDNSPIWDDVLKRIQLKPTQIPAYERKDTASVNDTERPTDDNYDRFVYLVDFFRQ